MPSSSQKTVPGQIVTAKYDSELGFLSLLVRTPDGKSRNMVLRKEIFTLHGVPCTSLSKEEADTAMENLAEAFRRSQGKRVACTLFEEQL